MTMTDVQPPAAAVAADAHWSAKMERIRSRKPLERPVDVWIDEDARMAVATAQADVTLAEFELERERDEVEKAVLMAKVADAKARLAAAEAGAGDATVSILLRQLDGDVYEQLQGEHPATDAQVEKAKKANEPAPTVNDDTFGPALLVACSVEGMPLADAQWLCKHLPVTERLTLIGMAKGLCAASRVDLGKGSSPTPS